MSWNVRGRGRKVRPGIEDGNETGNGGTTRQDGGGSAFSNFLVKSHDKSQQNGGLSVANKLSQLIQGSKRVVDVDSDSDDEKMGLFRRASSNESMGNERSNHHVTIVPTHGHNDVEEHRRKSARSALQYSVGLSGRGISSHREKMTAKTSSNRAVISQVNYDYDNPRRKVNRHVHISEKIIGRKGAKLIETSLALLQSQWRYWIVSFLLIDITKIRKHKSFFITVHAVHIILTVIAYILIPQSSNDFVMARSAYGSTLILAVLFFVMRTLPFPNQIQGQLKAFLPYIHFLKFVLFGCIFWFTTMLSFNYGTQFYNRINLCYKYCRFDTFDGAGGTTSFCERQYYINGTSLCPDDVFYSLKTQFTNINLTSYIVMLFQPVEIFILAVTAADISEAIEKGELFAGVEEDDEQLDDDLTDREGGD